MAVLLIVALTFQGLPGSPSHANGQEVRPGKAIDYKPMFPEAWKAKKQSTRMIPWEGKHVVLLTATADFDPKVIAAFLGRLDRAWQLFADYTGVTPQPHMVHNGKVTIAAVPDASFTCGAGCGHVGYTGIEVDGFYARDYPNMTKHPDVFADYYFYEMGRNYYRFGDRHSAFTTGFSVFMRYVCMDDQKCENRHAEVHKKLAAVEAEVASTNLSFLQAFTSLTTTGRDEYANLIAGYPSNQPAIYASAMLKLRRDYGGDEWVKEFFRYLRKCPAIPWDKDITDSGKAQGLNWLVAASCAARQDLSPIFVDRWKLPIGKKSRDTLKSVDWKKKDLSPSAILASLPVDELPASLRSTLSGLLPPEHQAANREAARRVLELGGLVRVKIDGEVSEVKDLGSLPDGPLTVVTISTGWANKQLKDDTLPFVRGLTELKELQVGGAEHITDKALVNLIGLKQLSTLGLDVPNVTDAGLETLTQLPALETLTMNGTKVTDRGVAKLATIKSLKVVWLSGTAVTDAGINELGKLPNLETLQVANTKVTARGVAALKAALPKLKVDR